MNPLPAIVIAGWNRPRSLNRLLGMVAKGHYPEGPIPLVISLDHHEDPTTGEIAEAFNWIHGPKTVIRHEAHLGLKEHIFSCGDLTERFGSLILLEDDLGVSPWYYRYAGRALEYYSEQEEVAGISLYSHRIAESNNYYPFQLADPADDVYFLQYAVSWGQCFTQNQWHHFRAWQQNGQNAGRSPAYLEQWSSHSWKREFIQYLLASNRWFVCPAHSLSTNFGEPGANFGEGDDRFQVPLVDSEYPFSFLPRRETLNVYDAWFELVPESLKSLCPGLREYDLESDLYGSKVKGQDFTAPWTVTVQPLSDPKKQWGMKMRPLWKNLVFEVPGKEIVLGKVAALQPASRASRLRRYVRMHQFFYPLPVLRSRLYYWILQTGPVKWLSGLFGAGSAGQKDKAGEEGK